MLVIEQTSIQDQVITLVCFPEFNSSGIYPKMDPMFVSPKLENFKVNIDYVLS